MTIALPELTEALIAGLAEDPPWSRFLDLLRAALRADYASIIFRPFAAEEEPDGRLVHLFSGRGSPPPVSRLYRERLFREDPLPYRALQAGRVYSLAELLREDDPAHAAYARALLAPSGMNVMRMMRIEGLGTSAWLTASRPHGEFAAADDALLSALAPLLTAALAVQVARQRERVEARIAGEAIRRMNYGWLTIDRAGRILDADATAEAILADPAVALHRDRARRLRTPLAEVRAAIADALASPAAAPRRPRAVVLSRQPWIDMLLVPTAFPADDARHAPHIAIYVHADRRSAADHYEHLRALFDLTPSEARLALALSRGMTIAEAAAEMKLSEGSARTYSKRIYSKTGARGQGDLIRFIHRSVMALA